MTAPVRWISQKTSNIYCFLFLFYILHLSQLKQGGNFSHFMSFQWESFKMCNVAKSYFKYTNEIHICWTFTLFFLVHHHIRHPKKLRQKSKNRSSIMDGLL